MEIQETLHDLKREPLATRLLIAENLLASIKDELKQSHKSPVKSAKNIEIPVFDMGNFVMPTREEIYDEACERHFKYE